MKKSRHQAVSRTQLERAVDWVRTFPFEIAYESSKTRASREQFLRYISCLTDPPLIVLLYLRDEDIHTPNTSFLNLAYAAPREAIDIKAVPKQLLLRPFGLEEGASKSRKFTEFDLFLTSSPHLEERPTRISLKPVCVSMGGFLDADLVSDANCITEVGELLIFIPKVKRNQPLLGFRLEFAAKHLYAEIVRSRQDRMTEALSALLSLIESRDHADNTKALCGAFNKYCRSHIVYLLERKAGSYTCIDSTEGAQLIEYKIFGVDPYIKKDVILRSHLFRNKLPQGLDAFIEDKPWMMVPCWTNAIDIKAGTHSRFPQYLFLLIGKDNVEYIGDDFSVTDSIIAGNLASFLSGHLPYIGLPASYQKVSSELESRAGVKIRPTEIVRLARDIVPSLYGIVSIPEFPSLNDAQYEPESFEVRTDDIKALSPDTLIPWVASGTSRNPIGEVYCAVFNCATEYRPQRRIVFAFTDKYLQNAQIQVLDVIAEHIRSAYKVHDFQEFTIATQAQIRHVIRGAMAAAVSDIALLFERVRVFSRMPTKLTKLFETPTMRDLLTDSSLWLQEAYVLMDSPRYLLGTFDRSAIRWSDVDPGSLVRWCLNLLKGEIRRRGLKVEYAADKIMQSRLISADAEFLRIVLFNLIDNAVKYSYQDRDLRLELKHVTSDRWRFEVTNVGVPIEPQERDRIFEPWTRSFRQQIKNRRPGTGLGLAVSLRVLEAHDDQVVFNYTSDKIGDKPPTAVTCFYFELSMKGKGEVIGRANYSL